MSYTYDCVPDSYCSYKANSPWTEDVPQRVTFMQIQKNLVVSPKQLTMLELFRDLDFERSEAGGLGACPHEMTRQVLSDAALTSFFLSSLRSREGLKTILYSLRYLTAYNSTDKSFALGLPRKGRLRVKPLHCRKTVRKRRQAPIIVIGRASEKGKKKKSLPCGSSRPF